MGNNCLQFKDKNILIHQQMIQEKSFFPAVVSKGNTIFTFGGYENVDKVQLKSCESYNIEKDRWSANEDMQLVEARSQASAALFKNHVAFVFGGYNKELGTLSSIERVDF
jgi:N-acetylneuraminic acid mutarotase